MCPLLLCPISCAKTASTSSAPSCATNVSNNTIFRIAPNPVKNAFACRERREPSITWMLAARNPVRRPNAINRSRNGPSCKGVNLLNNGMIKAGASINTKTWNSDNATHDPSHHHPPIPFTNPNTNASNGQPIATVSPIPFNRSATHVPVVVVLNPNRASSRNCAHHSNGNETDESAMPNPINHPDARHADDAPSTPAHAIDAGSSPEPITPRNTARSSRCPAFANRPFASVYSTERACVSGVITPFNASGIECALPRTWPALSRSSTMAPAHWIPARTAARAGMNASRDINVRTLPRFPGRKQQRDLKTSIARVRINASLSPQTGMKFLPSLLVVAALAGGGWYLWNHRPASSSPATAASRPTTATIENRSIRFAVTAAGDIGPAEQVSVRPEVNGKIEQLPVDVGDAVKKDALLFKLDDRDLQIEHDAQLKAVERTRLELGQAEREYKRAQGLFTSRLISEELFEDARTKFDLAKNGLDRAQKSLDLVADRLRRTRVTAPFDCTVLTRPISVGQAVSGSGGFNAGTEVLTIANLADLVINAHINQADVTRLSVGQEVDVTIEAIPGLRIKGRVERLAPQSTIKNNIRGFAARILLKDVEKVVRPGMTANLSIPVASAENVVAAPLASVFTETNPETRQVERYAYVRNGDDWEKRRIDIGVSDYFFAEVTRGLSSGDEVSLEDKSKSSKSSQQPGPKGAQSAAPSSGGSSSPASPKPASSPSR